MHQTNILRPLRALAAGGLAIAIVALGWGCQREPEAPTAHPYPPGLAWRAVEGAQAYRVQAWSGYRLVFEETLPDSTIVLTPAILRAMSPFDSLEIQVRALDGDEVIDTQRRILLPVSSGEG
jgi:hypothetical protein